MNQRNKRKMEAFKVGGKKEKRLLSKQIQVANF